MGHISYKTRLIFNGPKDKQAILDVLITQRATWNACSIIKFNIQKNSIVELHKAFYKAYRRVNPTVPAQVIISAEQSVLSIYRSIKSNKVKLTVPPIKKRLSIRLDARSFSYKNGAFSIISLGKRVKCKAHIYDKLADFLGKYPFGGPEIFVDDSGEVWISLTFEVPTLLAPGKLALGVDLGCRVNAATSEGKLYVDRTFNAQKRKLRFLKRRLQAKASYGSRSARKHLKKLRRKEHNRNKDFSHNLANRLLKDTKADTIVLENLKSIKVKKNKFKNQNRISQVPLYLLKQILTYKAPLLGKTVIQVSPSWTSQIDHKTGKKDGERKGRRYYSKTGVIYDSDVNAAINIAQRSKLPVSYGNVLDGQAKVMSPIVGGKPLTSPGINSGVL